MRRLQDFPEKLPRIPMLIVLLSALGACGDSIRSSTKPPVLSPPPAELEDDCAQPVRLPDRVLTQAEVEALWLQDRVALIDCGLTKELLEQYYRDRDRRLTGPR